MKEAADEGKGAVSLDGRLIDNASIKMAQNLLAKLEQINERDGERTEGTRRPRWDADDRRAPETREEAG
jgi:hypothetical protein